MIINNNDCKYKLGGYVRYIHFCTLFFVVWFFACETDISNKNFNLDNIKIEPVIYIANNAYSLSFLVKTDRTSGSNVSFALFKENSEINSAQQIHEADGKFVRKIDTQLFHLLFGFANTENVTNIVLSPNDVENDTKLEAPLEPESSYTLYIATVDEFRKIDTYTTNTWEPILPQGVQYFVASTKSLPPVSIKKGEFIVIPTVGSDGADVGTAVTVEMEFGDKIEDLTIANIDSFGKFHRAPILPLPINIFHLPEQITTVDQRVKKLSAFSLFFLENDSSIPESILISIIKSAFGSIPPKYDIHYFFRMFE